MGHYARVVAYAIQRRSRPKAGDRVQLGGSTAYKGLVEMIVQRICTPCPSKVSRTWVLAVGFCIETLESSLPSEDHSGRQLKLNPCPWKRWRKPCSHMSTGLCRVDCGVGRLLA